MLQYNIIVLVVIVIVIIVLVVVVVIIIIIIIVYSSINQFYNNYLLIACINTVSTDTCIDTIIISEY